MTTKELQITSYEQAVSLNDVGFDWDCFHAYRIRDNELGKAGELVDYQGNIGNPDYTTAPTVALALKWFREVQNIKNGVQILGNYKGLVYIGNYAKDGEETQFIGYTNSGFLTYEEAESALLDELLELIKTE